MKSWLYGEDLLLSELELRRSLERYCVVPGVLAYSFTVKIEDTRRPSFSLMVQVSDKGGQALFGKAARAFNLLDNEAKGDAKEERTDVDICGKFIVTCSKEGDDIFVCLFDAIIL